MFFAAQRVHHRRLEAVAERDELVVRALAARAAENADTVAAVEQRSKAIELDA